MEWEAVSAELAKKLDPKNVKPAKAYGPKGDYLEGWFCIDEANRIFGFGGWSYSLMECKCVAEGPRAIGKDKKPGHGVTYTATVRVTVDGVVRDDVGAGHGYDMDLGLAHESAIKEAVTDALKRSLRTFGNRFGLALYDKERANVGKDTQAQEATPPSNARAEADRIILKLRKQGTVEDLTAAWVAEKDARKAVFKADADLHENEIKGAFVARKTELQEAPF